MPSQKKIVSSFVLFGGYEWHRLGAKKWGGETKKWVVRKFLREYLDESVGKTVPCANL